MTSPFFGLQFSSAVTAQLLRTKKGIRRLFAIGRQLWWCKLTDRGLEFSRYGHRHQLVVSWTDVLRLAERRAGEAAIREKIAQRAEQRIAATRAGL